MFRINFSSPFTTAKNNAFLTPEDFNYSTMLPYAMEVMDPKYFLYAWSSGRASTKTSMASKLVVYNSYLESFKDASIICGREYATSLKATTYQAVASAIQFLDKHEDNINADDFKLVPSSSMIVNTRTGCSIYFKGCQDALSFKSATNLKLLWIEEAEKISYETLQIIIDSVRGDLFGEQQGDAIVIITYNPFSLIDPVKRFVRDQEQSTVRQKHWSIYDLPVEYQNKLSLSKAKHLQETNTALHDWVWLGKPAETNDMFPFANTGRMLIDDLKLMQHSIMFIDPSFKGVDSTAVSFLLEDGDKFYVLGYNIRLSWKDAFDIIAGLYKAVAPQIVYYEDNFIADTPQLDMAKHGIHINRYNTRYNKADKIQRCQYFKDNIILLEDNFSVCKEENKRYNIEVREWTRVTTTNGAKGLHDDAPDSMTSAFIVGGYFNKFRIS